LRIAIQRDRLGKYVMPAKKPAEAIPLSKEHFGPAADVLFRAFLDYPLLTYAVPDEARRRRACRSLYTSVLRYCVLFGETNTTLDLEGATCWLPPDRPFPTFWRMVRSGMFGIIPGFGWTGFQRLQAMDKVAEAEHHKHTPGPHWYLWVIGVDPPCQGRGVAGRLMQPVFERADRDGMRCYLETHKESNVAVYERYGFEVVSKTPVPNQPLTVWAMLRRPRKGAPSLA
jgi:ribosomal protein S18 acetylase RimI-like enzyme